MATIISGNTPSSFGDDVSAVDITANSLTLPTAPVVGYQQGNWIPDFGSTLTPPSFTASARVGGWSRIGNQVTVHFAIAVQVVSSAGTGNLTVTNLPYLSAVVGDGGRGVGSCYASGYSGNNPTYGLVSEQATEMRIYTYGASNAAVSVGAAAVLAGCSIYMTITYLTDDTTWTPINGATVS